MSRAWKTKWCFGYVLTVLSASVFLQFVTPARGQSPGAAGAVSEEGSGGAARVFDHYVARGGWVTVCTLIPLSIVALALSIEYAVSIRRKTMVPPTVVERLSDYFDRRQYAEAIEYCSKDSSMLGRIVHSGLLEARNGYGSMERAMEDAIEERASKLFRRIEYLNLIGNVAPMLGLFGTVQGIIGMFMSISEAGGIPVMSRISSDLGTALVATFWGLLVAIPSLTIFGLLRNRIDVLLAETATVADRLVAVFKPRTTEPDRPKSGAIAKGPAPTPAVVSVH